MPATRAPRPKPPASWAAPALSWVIGLVIGGLLLIPLGPPALLQAAWALNLPWSAADQAPSSRQPLTPTPPAGRLQEVSPPPVVQQLQQALAEHLPQVDIVSPRDNTTLSDGDWTLKLKVRDWPLVDAGPLGLGPHLVVQIDDQPPQRISGDGGPAASNGEQTLVLTQAPLTPGSHRITVYAARPWGEAVKSPGAVRQIRLHRLAANPLSLPAVGSAQLLPVSPQGSDGAEPLLLDWLLLDAPLQNLRAGDGSWRLKVTINGDSFLVDQAVPLWLKGWKNGRNSLVLELVDGTGEPLNPPFNSFVRAIELNAPGTSGNPLPRWRQGRLSPDELAVLLGERSPEPPPTDSPDTDSDTAAASTAAPQPVAPPAAPAQAPGADPSPADPSLADAVVVDEPNAQEPTTENRSAEETLVAEPLANEPGGVEPVTVEPVAVESRAIESGSDEPSSDEPNSEEPASSESGSGEQVVSAPVVAEEVDAEPVAGQPVAEEQDAEEAVAAQDVAAQQASEEQAAEEQSDDVQAAEELVSEQPVAGDPMADAAAGASNPMPTPGQQQMQQPEQANAQDHPPTEAQPQPMAIEPSLPAGTPRERISSSTSLDGSARELVNPDGSLRRPAPQGPLSGLRQLLQR